MLCRLQIFELECGVFLSGRATRKWQHACANVRAYHTPFVPMRSVNKAAHAVGRTETDGCQTHRRHRAVATQITSRFQYHTLPRLVGGCSELPASAWRKVETPRRTKLVQSMHRWSQQGVLAKAPKDHPRSRCQCAAQSGSSHSRGALRSRLVSNLWRHWQ